MKKVLSIALAVVMMFAVCVPAFAVDITKETDQSADVAVKTKIDTNDISYTVTVPADIEITWGDNKAYDASYTVTTQLFAGDTLDVEVAAKDGSTVMTATDASITDTLNFALTNGGKATFGAAVTNAAPENAPAVSIADFSGVTVTEYVGYLTYTVTYNAATVTP